MQRFINWLGRSISASRAARPSHRPVAEELETRLAPATITMSPEARGESFNTYLVEVIRISASSTPVNLTLSQGPGEIRVLANTSIDYQWYTLDNHGNHDTTHTAIRPFQSAILNTDLNHFHSIEIYGSYGNNLNIQSIGVPVTLTPGTHSTITLGEDGDGVQSIQGSISIQGDAVSNTLIVNDQANAGPRTVSIDAPGMISGLAPAAISYTPTQGSAVTMLLGSGADTVYVEGVSVPTNLVAGGNATINVDAASAEGFASTLNVQGGTGRPTLNINCRATDAARNVTLNTGTGNGAAATITGATAAPITFSNAQTAAVNFNLSVGSSLSVNGANDSTPRNITVDAIQQSMSDFGDFETITGLMPAAVRYNMGDLANVTIHTGTGVETLNVLSTGMKAMVPMTVVGHSSDTTVNVGRGNVGGILGSLTVTNTTVSGTVLNFNDWADAADRSITLDTVAPVGIPGLYGTITSPALGSISYRTSAVRGVNVWTGTGAESVNVHAASVPLGINGRSSNTAVNFGSNGSMNRITAAVTVSEFLAKAGVSVTLDDSADPVNRTVTVGSTGRSWYDAAKQRHDGYAITGLAPASIYYDLPSVSSLTLHTGTGTELVNVRAFAAPNLRLVAHSNSTTFDVGVGAVQNVHTSLHVMGAVMSNGAWSTPRLVIDDSGDASPQSLTVVPISYFNDHYSFMPITMMVPSCLITGFSCLSVFASAFVDVTSIAIKTGSGGATVTGASIAPFTLIGSPAAANTLNSGAGTWTLTGPNAGRIGTLAFTGFGNLNGNLGNDTFVFLKGASVSGTLNGGGGNDTLDYTSFVGNVMVNLQTSQATAVGHLAGSFGTVIGASGAAPGAYNILVGDGGTLKGGTGRRNLLIAGSKASTLLGGDDQDILIAGSTTYDQTNGASLIAVMKEWNRTDESYATRVAHLTNGVGAPRLDRTTVTSNHAGNLLTGDAGVDWFFASQAMDATDKSSSESLFSL